MKGVPLQDHTQLVCSIVDDSELLGYVVIDSVVGGQACGGLRMLPDVDEEEMRGLARAMTLKYGFLGLPQGGAKAGVRGDPEAPQPERLRCLTRFSRAIAPLLRSRLYVPGTDMGTTNADVRHLLQVAGVPVRHRELRGTQSGYYTALTVLSGARQAARRLGFELDGATVAIEGYGSVGSALGRLLGSAGARVVAVSTSRGAILNTEGLDLARLSALAQQVGSRLVDSYPDAKRLDREALLEVPVDLLCPCARHHSIHSGNAARVQARAVCPGANNPLTPDAERLLTARGALCLPDFVTNCGGVLGGTMEFASVNRARIESFVRERFDTCVAKLLNQATQQNVPVRQVAESMALRRLEQVQQRVANPTPRDRIFRVGLELYRRGWVPGRLVARLSLPYFEGLLA